MGSIISTSIMVIILVVIIVMAVRSSMQHLKGEGGCCGGGGGELKAERKKLEGKKIAGLKVMIEGMHCENCKNRIERAINDMDGAVAEVHLKQNYAMIFMDREIETEEFVKRIEDLDFHVTDVQAETVS